MTENHDLLAAAVRVAAGYPVGVTPGLHPVEILGGLHYGFSLHQLDAISADPHLQRLVGDALDREGPTPALLAAASADTDLGRAHRRLLESSGHGDDGAVAQAVAGMVAWLALADAPQALVARSASEDEGETDRWTLPDRVTDATVLVERDGDTYRVSVTPERTRGAAQLLARWEGEAQPEAVPVHLEALRTVEVTLRARGRRLAMIAFVVDGQGQA